MRKLIFIAVVLLAITFLASQAEAVMFISGGAVAPAGCSQGAMAFSEDFELIAEGEEWDDDGNWTEATASTDKYIGDNAIVNEGNLSGQVNTSGSHWIDMSATYTSIGGTGTATFQHDFYYTTSAEGATVILTDGNGQYGVTGNQRVYMQVASGGKLQNRGNGGSWYDVLGSGFTANTWHTIEVEIDLEQSDGIEALTYWVNGSQISTLYDTRNRSDPGSGIDTIAVNGWISSTPARYYDDIRLYDGDRCAP